MKNSLFTFLLYLISSISIFGQNLPSLLIDNVSTQFSEVSLPYWLKAGQTINIGTNAQSVSILEFTVNGSNLEFSQTIALKTAQTVPANKVWKIEAIGLKSENSALPSSTFIGSASSSTSTASLPTIFQSPKKFETPGTYSWTVPPGVTSICVEAWGGGGGGSGCYPGGIVGSGGGGGGYAYQCFSVLSGTTYSVIVGSGGGGGSIYTGNGGNGGASSVGNLINSSAGIGGIGANGGGAGGTSMNTFKVIGGDGSNGSAGGAGGNGGNGGAGGFAVYNTNGNPGVIPGAGGSGGNTQGGAQAVSGGAGARGQVYIYW